MRIKERLATRLANSFAFKWVLDNREKGESMTFQPVFNQSDNSKKIIQAMREKFIQDDSE